MLHPDVAPGVIAAMANVALTAAIASSKADDERLVIINSANSFLTRVPTDGRRLIAEGQVHHRLDDILVHDRNVTDEDGRIVSAGHGLCMLRPVESRPARRMAERVLLTVLFTDIVGSTERAGQLGDAAWNELLGEHDAFIRRKVAQFKGREVNTTGDGFVCTFESPTRAVQAAQAMREGVRRLGLELRVGVHTGECEVTGGDLVGLAVHVASRLQSEAGPSEILLSSTVRDLIAGSGVAVEDRGSHQLKGLDGSWSLFAVE